MPYPNFEGKHERAALFGPHDFLAYLQEQGGLHADAVPESFVLCYERRLLDEIERSATRRPVAHRNKRHFAVEAGGAWVGIAGGFGIGAPAATVVIEELIALGTQRFISVGLAGALSSDLCIGDIVVCSEAVRDEGVSHHYLPPGRTAVPSYALTSRLERELDRTELAFVNGPTWTIDTPYRETIDEVHHYQAEGVLTVEMEAAALFAVGAYRGIEVSAAFVISDLLANEQWHGQHHDALDALNQLYRASLAALNPE